NERVTVLLIEFCNVCGNVHWLRRNQQISPANGCDLGVLEDKFRNRLVSLDPHVKVAVGTFPTVWMICRGSLGRKTALITAAGAGYRVKFKHRKDSPYRLECIGYAKLFREGIQRDHRGPADARSILASAASGADGFSFRPSCNATLALFASPVLE